MPYIGYHFNQEIILMSNSLRHHSAKVLSTMVDNSIVAMGTDLWCHLTYGSR